MMGWFLNDKKRAREEERDRKLSAGHMALIEAATITADAAQQVTSCLKMHLDETIQQLDTTVRIITDALLVCTSDGRITVFNPAAELLYGCNTTEAKNISITKFFSLAGITPSSAELYAAIDAHRDGIEETSLLCGVRNNSETFPIEATVSHLHHANGSEMSLLLVRDLSYIAELRQEITTLEHRYRLFFDMSNDGILIVQKDCIVAANQAAGKIFEKDDVALLGMCFETVVGPSRLPFDKLTKSNITWNDEPAYLITIKDGCVNSDSRVCSKSVYENGVDMILCFSPDYKITFVNEVFCRYFKKPKQQLLGSTILDFLPEPSCTSFLSSLQKLTPECLFNRSQIRSADGQITDWVDHVSFDEHNNPVEYQRTGRDISSLIR